MFTIDTSQCANVQIPPLTRLLLFVQGSRPVRLPCSSSFTLVRARLFQLKSVVVVLGKRSDCLLCIFDNGRASAQCCREGTPACVNFSTDFADLFPQYLPSLWVSALRRGRRHLPDLVQKSCCSCSWLPPSPSTPSSFNPPFSFWGPTRPAFLLRLKPSTLYRKFSPPP